jgi:hypothetical protein
MTNSVKFRSFMFSVLLVIGIVVSQLLDSASSKVLAVSSAPPAPSTKEGV